VEPPNVVLIGSRPLAALFDDALASAVGVFVSTFAFSLVALSAAAAVGLLPLRRRS
jgi:hypothetical protein